LRKSDVWREVFLHAHTQGGRKLKIGKFLSVLLLVISTIVIFSSAGAQEIDWRQFEGTTINVLLMPRGYTQGLQMLLPEFEQLTGIKVTMEFLAEATLVQKEAVELAGHSDAYDVMYTYTDRIPQYVKAGWIVPLDEYIANEKLTDPSYLDIADFIESTLEGFRHKGKLYGLPTFAGTVIMYYRNDVFKNYGIAAPPETFDDLLAVCRKIHTEDLPAIAMRGQTSSLGNLWHWSMFLYGYGGHYFKNYPEDLTPIIDSPEAVKALEVYCELMQNYSIPGAASANYDDVVLAMQQGKVAIALEGAPLGGRILDPKQSKVIGKLGFYLVPGGPAGRFPPFLAHGFSIPSGSKHKEAAWLFLQWATSPKVALRVHLLDVPLVDISVSRNSIWTDKDFIQKYEYNFGAGSFLEAFHRSLQIAPFWYRPAFEKWPEVGDRVALAVSEAIVKKKTPEEALKDAQRDVVDILKRADLLK